MGIIGARIVRLTVQRWHREEPHQYLCIYLDRVPGQLLFPTQDGREHKLALPEPVKFQIMYLAASEIQRYHK